MNRKLNQLLQGNLRIYFVVLILFTAMMATYSWKTAAGQLAIVLALGLYKRENDRRRRREINKYLEEK